MTEDSAIGRLTTTWPMPMHLALFGDGNGDETFRNLAQAVISTARQRVAQGGTFSRTAEEIATEHGAARVCILQAIEGSGRLLALAEAHLLTGEQQFGDRCAELLEAYLGLDWFQGEYDLGVAIWLGGLLPAASWLLQSPSGAVRQRANDLVAPLVLRAKECAGRESEYAERAIANARGPIQNHVFIAACALGQAGLVMGSPEGDAHVDRALEVVRNHLFVSDKVGPDGDWFEACPQYQFFLLDHAIFFADACQAAGRIDLYRQPKMRKMFEAFLHFACPDGAFLDFNDSMAVMWKPDPVLARGASEYRDAELAWLIALPCNTAAPPYSSALKDAQFLRYYDPTRIPAPTAPELPTDVHFPLIGQVVSRSNWGKDGHWFALNGGPVQPHAHIDRGTFTFYYCGRPVMVDGGRGSYVNRYDFVLPEKHNVVFTEPGVAFERKGEGWGNDLPYDAELRRFLTGAEMTFVETDIARMATCRSAFRRVFFSKTGYLIIVDELEDDRERIFRAIYHGIGALEQDGARAVWRQPDALCTELYLLSPTDVEWTTGTHPVLGRAGVDKQPFVDIRCRGTRAWYVAVIFPRRDDADGNFEIVETGQRNVLKITRDGAVDTWIIKDDVALTLCGDIETDARVTWLRERDRVLAAWGVFDGWEVRHRGMDLLSGRSSAKMRQHGRARSRTWLADVPRE